MTTVKSEEGKDKYSKDDEWVMGIDEAGRGPVLGAMLYGACICPRAKLEDLKTTGVFDSKQLTDEKRRELFKMIKRSSYLHWIIDSIPADWMSESMMMLNRFSLNEISHQSAMNLIQITLDKGFNLKHVYLDTVGPPESYEQKLLSHFMGYDLRFTVAKKADALYPVVSAASICAKVTRDDILEQWQFVERHLKDSNPTPKSAGKSGSTDRMSADEDEDDDIDISMDGKSKNKGAEQKEEEEHWLGSGYPGHELTKKFLQDHVDKVFGFPNIVRFSWQTAKTIIDQRCAKVTFADETANNNLSKWGFGTAGKVKRSRYFKDRNLKLCLESPF